MLEVDNQLKSLLKSDAYSARVYTFTMYDEHGDIELQFSNENIVGQDVVYTDSVCEGDSLVYGQCNAASISLTTAEINETMIGGELEVTLTVGEYDPIPMGFFVIHSAEKDRDRVFHKIVAYDRMTLFDVDVAGWFNSLWEDGADQISVKEFREQLCVHVGVAYEEVTLINDSISVTKSITSNVIGGRDMLSAICEINGVFGRIGRDGILHFISLGSDIAETYTVPITMSCYREDYEVLPIDRIVIREQDNDVGVDFGTGDNAYIIQGNFIAYGKTEAELLQIAQNLHGQISGVTYTPFNGNFKGLAYLEAGDRVAVNLRGGTIIYSYILSRSLSGVQAQVDNMEALGNRESTEVFGVKSELLQLLGKSYSIERSVEGVKATVQTMETQLGTTETRVSEIEHDITGLTATVASTGGANLLRNSSAQFGSEYWEGLFDQYTDTEIKTQFSAGSCLKLRSGSITQTIEVANGDYYIGLKYKKLLPLANVAVIINDSADSTVLDSMEYTAIDIYDQLHVDTGRIKISIVSSDDASAYIGDIIICRGGKREWSPNSSETYSASVQIGKGIQVESNTTNTYTRIDSDGNRIYNKSSRQVVTEMTDKGIITESVQAETANIGGFAFAKVNGSLWIYDTEN